MVDMNLENNLDNGTQTIIRHLTESKATPAVLLGAGASFESGVPGASAIASNVRRRLYPNENFDDKGEDNQLARFESVMSTVSGGDQLMSQLLAQYLDDLTPSQSHRKLVDLMITSRIAPWIFTTNYDTLIEQSLAERNCDFRVYFSGQDVVHDDGVINVVKLHGCITRPETVRCTPDSILELPESSASLLKEVVHNYGLVIIGHSMRDPDLEKCLLEAERTRGMVAVIAPNANLDSVKPILGHHKSTMNIGTATFGEFITSIHSIKSLQSAYETDLESLPEIWASLDRARFGSLTTGLISDLENQVTSLQAKFQHIPEVSALYSLVRANSGGQVGWWQMNDAIRTLGRAVDERGNLPLKARSSLVGRYLFESLLAIWAGADLKISFGTDQMFDVLQTLVDLGTDEQNFLLQENREHMTQSLLSLGLAEALKELYAINVNGTPKIELLHQAKELLTSITERKRPGTQNNNWNAETFRIGTALRHLAVVHEYLASQEISKSQRIIHLRKWHELSQESAELLNTIDERWIRSFSLMNQAMAAITLRKEDEPGLLPDRVALNGLRLLEVANQVFVDGEDERALAWSFYQMAYARLQLTEVGLLLLKDEVKEIYRLAAGGARAARRAQTDPVVAGMSDLIASFSLLTMAKDPLEKRRIELLEEVLETARRSRALLTGGHGAVAAAKSAQIECEARLMLSDLGVTPRNDAIADGLTLLSEALSLLLKTGSSIENECERDLFTLRDTIARLVPNIGL